MKHSNAWHHPFLRNRHTQITSEMRQTEATYAGRKILQNSDVTLALGDWSDVLVMLLSGLVKKSSSKGPYVHIETSRNSWGG